MLTAFELDFMSIAFDFVIPFLVVGGEEVRLTTKFCYFFHLKFVKVSTFILKKKGIVSVQRLNANITYII